MQAVMTPQQRREAKQKLLEQIKQGASVEEARSVSVLSVHRATVYRLLKRVQSHEGTFVDGRRGHAIKLRGDVLTFLTERCQAKMDLPSSALRDAIQERFSLTVSISQLNRVRASLGLTRKPGPQKEKPKAVSVEPGYSDGAGGLLLLAAANETGLLTQLQGFAPLFFPTHIDIDSALC